MSDSPDKFAQATGDTQGVVTLVDFLNNLIGAPLREKYRRQRATKQLLEDLGEWAAEAKDAKGRWLQPILRAGDFEKHLKANDGYFKPGVESSARFAWARLLHALDIQPGRNILSWRLPTEDIDPANAVYQIPMDIDGEVLCHIINLYRIYTKSDPRDTATEESTSTRYPLSFGALVISKEDDQVMIKFEPGTPAEIESKKQPFRYSRNDIQYYLPGQYLRYNRDVVVTKYLDFAIQVGVSEPTMVLPEETDKSTDRARELVRIVQMLRASTPQSPYLLTPSWLEKASRIYRRTTSDTSENPTLPQDIVLALKNKAEQTDYIKDFFTGEDVTWQNSTEAFLKAQCMLPNQSIRHLWGTVPSSTLQSERLVMQFLSEEFQMVMNAFKTAPAGSPRRILAEIPEAARYLFTLPRGHEIRNKPGVVLEFTPESRIWHSECQIRC